MNLLRTSSQKRLFRSVIVYFLTFCMFFNASLPVVLAGPEGAQVVNGDVAIQQSGYNTTITASDKAIINYSSFDIARPEIVQFIQPDTSASVLNRILSANPTNINGTLLANGRVFFVNPAGVYFGNGAQVNVNQLVASALNITDADFINGRYNFVGGEGSVINEGDIFAEKVYLIGRQVANSGSISCP
ncbi:MAG: two-partner secretion domain-containing protein, partial [Planctomycetota bacterium]